MNDNELEQLERELHALRAAFPPDTLRERVLSRVERDMRRERRAEWIGYAAAAAALFALWANLSWIATLREPQQPASPENVRAEHTELVVQLHELLPGLSAKEIQRQADLLVRHSGLPEGQPARRATALGIRQF